ncbi:Tat pathway signal protein [Brevundimonas diminuta]|uniref:Tat pathway signal protein n=1 Tax=Brevundimonas TaxID=41275 RepID=UPI00106DB70A|nr:MULTISPECIES: Tat pathway signal protein [Brevundimonas]MCO8030982.1 Tat pathway signal protein [Brevundimonas diminuta]QBQ49677.1 Tat pathway signal protein [Brevundimonas naejangsanensis]
MDRRHLIGLTLSAWTLAGAAQASPDKSGGGKGGYLSLPTATATVLRRDGRRGVMTVETGLDIADGALMERARLSQPRLSAAYNEIVRIAAERLLPDAPPNVEWLVVALQHATDAILGKPGAKLLLGTVMVG